MLLSLSHPALLLRPLQHAWTELAGAPGAWHGCV